MSNGTMFDDASAPRAPLASAGVGVPPISSLPGTKIEISGQKWTVPPLTLGQLRRLAPELGKITARANMLDAEVIAAVIKVVTTALLRNYPDLAEETVEEMLDLGNAGEVLNAVLAGSGLRRGAGSGEDRAATSKPTPAEAGGTNSTASSPPPSAIARETSTS
jgi:hypothetical protein